MVKNGVIISAKILNSERGNGYTTNRIEKETIDGVIYEYGYDPTGNITSIKMTDGDYVKNLHYTYDSKSQLIREDNEQTGKSYVYTYDDAGNILTKSEHAYTREEVGSVIESYNYSYDNSNWKDQLTSLDNQTIQYDELGNPTTYKGNTHSWSGRKLTAIGNTITYTYDGNGQRISKTINGQTTSYVYQEGRLIEEIGPIHQLKFTYDDKGNLAKITRYTDNVEYVYYVVTNTRGDVIGLYETDGTLICRYVYDAWGNVEKVETKGHNMITSLNHIANINPILYRGYYYDRESGYYYLNSRYYDPEIGRFINADDISVISLDPTSLYDKNLYAYCDNNPVSRVDENGDFWDTAFDLISLGSSIIEVAINPTDPLAWIGLAGDTIDLIPFVTGVGEVTKAVFYGKSI